MTTNQDYYDLLGVSKTAAQDEIKKAFKKKAAQLHPDNKDTGDEAKFKDLVAAYEVLSDEQKRSVYDRYGAEGLKGQSSRFDNMDFGSFGDLGDIFEMLFGAGMRSQRRRSEPERGSDLKYDLELDFLEAVFGVEKTINIKHLEDCTECKATGAAPGSQPVQCKTCAGMGQVRQTSATLFGQFTQVMPCPHCNGEGTKIDRPCEICKGKAQVRKPRTIELKVPAGVDNGARLRVGGGGDFGRKGAPPGDLYVVLHVRKHPLFQRDGHHVHIQQPVSFSMAALGGELLIDTVHGQRVLKIPPGTQGGTVMTMKEQGVPHLGAPQRKGDQYVHISVETPSKLSDEEKQLFKRLAELRGEELHVNANHRDGNSKEGHSFFDVIAGVFKPKNSATDE